MPARNVTGAEEIKAAYESVKTRCDAGPGGSDAENAILALVDTSLVFLADKCSRVALISLVVDKKYSGYTRTGAAGTSTRPLQDSLFITDATRVRALWRKWSDGKLSVSEAEPMLYTMALAPCLAMELFDRQNKKGPATYFEHFIGHVFARTLGIQPTKKASLSFRQERLRLTTTSPPRYAIVCLHSVLLHSILTLFATSPRRGGRSTLGPALDPHALCDFASSRQTAELSMTCTTLREHHATSYHFRHCGPRCVAASLPFRCEIFHFFRAASAVAVPRTT